MNYDRLITGRTVAQGILKLKAAAEATTRAEHGHHSCEITLPLPPRECHPNTSGIHWARKAKAKKSQRETAWAIAFHVRGNFEQPIIAATFYGKTSHKKDRDNSIASLKSAIDGLVDAGLFADDSLVRWGEIEFDKDAANPRVVLRIVEMKSK